MKNVKFTKGRSVGGSRVPVGAVLSVGKDISETAAKKHVSLGNAEWYSKPAKKKAKK